MSTESRSSFSGRVIDLGGEGGESRFLQVAGRKVLLVIWMISVLAVVCLGSSPADCTQGEGSSLIGSPLELVFPEVELVRCVFSEGRLVVQHHGQLKVLRAGDRLTDAGLMVLDANRQRITLQSTETRVLPDGQAVPKAMVILSRGEDGGLSARIFRSENPKGTVDFSFPNGRTGSWPPSDNRRAETAVASSKSGIESEGHED